MTIEAFVRRATSWASASSLMSSTRILILILGINSALNLLFERGLDAARHVEPRFSTDVVDEPRDHDDVFLILGLPGSRRQESESR